METTIHVWQVSGMHCSSCSILIDEAVEELDGVASSTTSLTKNLTTVTLDPAVCDPEQVVAAIQEVGYLAIPAGENGEGSGRRWWFRRGPS